MKRKKILSRVVTVVVMLLISLPAYATHRWSIYHWARTSNPLPLLVVDSVTSFWQFEFETALDEWDNGFAAADDVDVLDLTVTAADDSSKTRRQCKAVQGEMRVCNQSYGNTGWLGVASINIDSAGHITQGTAKMNDFYSSYWTDPNEKRHVMCQEIGHVFGLDHQSTDGSSQQTCMDYSNDPNSISPNQHDYDELDIIYAHLDDYNTYASAGGGGGGGGGGGNGCNAPPGKGCNKFGAEFEGKSPMGIPVEIGLNHETWIAADGHGGYWVHHITLVPGRKAHK
ncbi:MAG: hypothetical protein PVF89_07370 [Lysobacterales bacterium]|jgi:hypothetical protein